MWLLLMSNELITNMELERAELKWLIDMTYLRHFMTYLRWKYKTLSIQLLTLLQFLKVTQAIRPHAQFFLQL